MASMDGPPTSGRITEDDVLLSSRHQGTGSGFTSHLEAALRRRGLNTRISNVSKLIILGSCMVTLVVFTPECPRSTTYLDELEEIVERSKKKRQVVVPVFYDVDPSTVRKQTGSYAEAFEIHEQNFQGNKEKLQSWRNALTQVSSYSGWVCNNNVRTEHEMVEDIAEFVVEKVNGVHVGYLDLQIEKLEQLAHIQEEFKVYSSEINERNHKATLERISRLKTEKKLRMLRLPPELLSHMEISPTTNSYF